MKNYKTPISLAEGTERNEKRGNKETWGGKRVEAGKDG